jgi:hypothetical protein
VPITSVGGTDTVRSNQTGVVILGSGFGASKGAGSVTLRYGTRSVTLPDSAWADGSITVAMALGNIPFGKPGTVVRVTTNGGTTMERAVTFLPPTGHAYVWLTSVNPVPEYGLVALPNLAAGVMVWYCGVGQVAVPAGLLVNADGTHLWTPGNAEQPWLARAWDPDDESYQPSFALQYYTLTPPAPSPGGGGAGVVVATGRPLRAAGPRVNWRR